MWMGYHRIMPIGPVLDDLRAGTICAVFANIYRGKGKPAVKPRGFMPDYLKEPDPEPQPGKLSAKFQAAKGILDELSKAQGHGQ